MHRQVDRYTNKQVISGHITFLGNKFNLVVDKENKKLSNIYWTPILDT